MSQRDCTAYRRLRPPAEGDWPFTDEQRRPAVQRRDAGLQQVRRISAWTTAVLVAGTAAGVGYFARAASNPAGAAPSAAASMAGATHGTSQKPSVSHPVVTSGGSGVTAGGPVSRTGAASWGDN
jgi:hypothetical protein